MQGGFPLVETRQHNVTHKDVAEEVGVSAMTVSRALSGKAHLVSSDTVRRCRNAAEKLGYVPNLMARSLRGEQLRTIVMLAEHMSSHQYLAQLVDTVAHAIEQRGYGVISCQSTGSFRQALKNFKLAGAVIIAPPQRLYQDIEAERRSRRMPSSPAVVIHSAIKQSFFNEVSPDITAFTHASASHLIELGHRHIAYVGGPRADEEPLWFELRRQGIEQALSEHGLPLTHYRHQPCPETELAPAALQQLLARFPETTGVICINDEVAVASVVGAEKMGLRVPRDLSVIGGNDIKLARFFRPALTTLSIDVRTMVETALNLLFDEINQQPRAEETEPVKISMTANLVVRESTGPPPKAS